MPVSTYAYSVLGRVDSDDHFVTFEYQDEGGVARLTAKLSVDLFLDLGEPDIITVSIEPGDNEG